MIAGETSHPPFRHADLTRIVLDPAWMRAQIAESAERAVLDVAGSTDLIAALIPIGRGIVERHLNFLTAVADRSDPAFIAEWRGVLVAAFVARFVEIQPQLVDGPGQGSPQ